MACQGVAVAVQAAARQPDHHVAGGDVGADQQALRVQGADAGADQLERVAVVAVHHLAQLGDLAAGDVDVRLAGAVVQALGDRRQRVGVDVIDGDVVHQRHRPGTDADDVVDVHRHAVDAHRVVPPEVLGDEQLGADAVGGDRHGQLRAQRQHVGVVAERQHGPDGIEGEGGVDPLRHTAQPGVHSFGIDPHRFVRQRHSARTLAWNAASGKRWRAVRGPGGRRSVGAGCMERGVPIQQAPTERRPPGPLALPIGRGEDRLRFVSADLAHGLPHPQRAARHRGRGRPDRRAAVRHASRGPEPADAQR